MMPRADSLEKTLMLARLKAKGEGDNRGRDTLIASLTLDMNLSKLWEIVKDRGPWLLCTFDSLRVPPAHSANGSIFENDGFSLWIFYCEFVCRNVQKKTLMLGKIEGTGEKGSKNQIFG